MNNNDRFEDAQRRDLLEAAALALQFADGCGSKSAAWNWAGRAISAAAEVGVALEGGSRSWPNTEAMREQLQAAQRRGPETVIVSRHAGAVEWLAAHGVTGQVIAQAAPDDVRGRIVVGNLPLHLAALALRVGSIDLPHLAAADRGRDLTPAEMDAAGACIRWYEVKAVQP